MNGYANNRHHHLRWLRRIKGVQARGIAKMVEDDEHCPVGAARAGGPEQACRAGRPNRGGNQLGRPRVAGSWSSPGTVKASSTEAIQAACVISADPVLLTGANPPLRPTVAQQVGIDPVQVEAKVLLSDKVPVIKDLQTAGRVVAMVGDEVNNAAPLAQADLVWTWGPAQTLRSRPATRPWSAAICGSRPTSSGSTGAP